MQNPLNDIEDEKTQIDLGIFAARVYRGALEENNGNRAMAFWATAAFFKALFSINEDKDNDA